MYIHGRDAHLSPNFATSQKRISGNSHPKNKSSSYQKSGRLGTGIHKSAVILVDKALR